MRVGLGCLGCLCIHRRSCRGGGLGHGSSAGRTPRPVAAAPEC
ncbi:hypothetical protein RAN3_3262 [plant metagenome]|uniref:Uncharacterized protein n=1 Tax=plant metagenome TaxID=1297885 RepID=A0A484UXB4_9ZZZZ